MLAVPSSISLIMSWTSVSVGFNPALRSALCKSYHLKDEYFVLERNNKPLLIFCHYCSCHNNQRPLGIWQYSPYFHLGPTLDNWGIGTFSVHFNVPLQSDNHNFHGQAAGLGFRPRMKLQSDRTSVTSWQCNDACLDLKLKLVAIIIGFHYSMFLFSDTPYIFISTEELS